MTTGMERLTAAINGQPCDRIPAFSIMLEQGPEELGVSAEEYYSSGELVAEGQLRLRKKYGYDNVWGMFYFGKEAELFGCKKIIFADNGPPNVGQMVIRTPEDIHKLEIPHNIEEHPAFAEPLKCLRILRKEIGGKYPICVALTASMTLPAMLIGMEKWMELLLTGPFELRDELLAKCSDYFRAHLAALRKAGADIFFYVNPLTSPDFVPMKLIHELTRPWMQRDLAGVDMSGLVFFCAAARVIRNIDFVIDSLGFEVVCLSPWDDIAEAKRIAGGRALMGSPINDLKLLHWSEAEIRAEVRRIMSEGMPGGQFYFGTLLMPQKIPERNIHALFNAAREYGALLPSSADLVSCSSFPP
jgi:uroporphyrinogen-III decarboxylase